MMRAQKNSSPYFHEVEAKAYVAMLVSFESDLLNIMHDAFLLYSHDLNQRSATYLALTEAFDNILRISVQAYAGEIEDFDSNVS